MICSSPLFIHPFIHLIAGWRAPIDPSTPCAPSIDFRHALCSFILVNFHPWVRGLVSFVSFFFPL
jgi:hypothetical protein